MRVNEGTERQRRALTILVVVFLTVLVYAPVGSFGFVNQDDPTYILQNPYVQDGLTARSLGWAFTALYFSNWHPLTWLSYLVDISVFGIDPRAMHLVNLLFHAINTALLAHVMTRMTRAFWASVFVAAAFALHPLHVESVAWISERKDVLSTMYWLLAMLAYTRYAERGRIADYLWTLLAFATGLLAKPMVITLPCVLLLLDYWPLQRRVGWTRCVAEKLPFFALAAGSAVMTIIAQQRGGAMGDLESLSMPYRAANAIAAYGGYLWKTVWPVSLSPFYPHPGAAIATWKPLAALLVLIAISAVAYVARVRKPYVHVGWLWFLGTLVPVIGLVQVGSQAMADRYTYIPLIGIFTVVAWLGRDAVLARPQWTYAIRGAAVLSAVAMAALSAGQVRIWRDTVTLFQHALAVTPENSGVYTNLGVALAEQERYAEAIPHFQTVARMQPDSARTYYNLALAYERTGDVESAESHYRKCLEIDPAYADAANNLGMIAMSRGEVGPARALFEQALQAEPEHLMARINMGDAFAAEARWDEAAAEYERVLRIFHDFPLALYRLAVVRMKQGRMDEARALVARCLQVNPVYGEAKALQLRLEQQ